QHHGEWRREAQEWCWGFTAPASGLRVSSGSALATGRSVRLLGLLLHPAAKGWFARQAMGLGIRSEV
ncbi:2-octaprenyl-6-methoxyphenyl hydroxylase, partial [Pseudomonas syringae]